MPMRELASGLGFPEGPIALDDGSVLVVEIAAGNLTRVDAEGAVTVVAHCGGGPNGAALGPDGAVYVCNDGGLEFVTIDGIHQPIALAADNTGGRIQRVDLDTGQIDTVYTHWGDQPITATNDIVFDTAGCFYFIDTGSGAIYYADPDGSSIDRVASGLEFPNGMGLSPDGQRLYASETYAGPDLSLGRRRPWGAGGALLAVLDRGRPRLGRAGGGRGGKHLRRQPPARWHQRDRPGRATARRDRRARTGSVCDQHLLRRPRSGPSVHHLLGTGQALPDGLAVPRSTAELRRLGPPAVRSAPVGLGQEAVVQAVDLGVEHCPDEQNIDGQIGPDHPDHGAGQAPYTAV